MEAIRGALVNYPFAIGLTIRLVVALVLPWALDSGRFIPGVAYTDIDFHVYSDAARHIQQGGNPFDRVTYRYTPFLAEILAALPTKESARYLFCVADAVCGWILLTLRRRKSKKNRLEDAAWWLYNPLPINICTRGSAESFIVLLPVLLAVWIVTNKGNRLIYSAVMAGICHGVAIHAKLYPIIYTLSLVTNFVAIDSCSTARLRGWGIVTSWVRRLLNPAPILFGFVSLGVFGGLTWASVVLYGDVALQEGLLYHFSRVDHRHNYSMHWYWIYLVRAQGTISMAWVGRLLLVPQLCLLVYTSLGVAPHNLPLALFLQTFLFVAHNKVITAQYFTWYLCLLPLCSDQFRFTKRVRTALIILGCSIVFWLGSAYCLEMLGLSVHRIVWIASSMFFMANINLLGALLSSIPVRASEKVD